MIPTSRQRVSVHTSRAVNTRFARQLEENVRHFADHPSEIERRLRELDAEWDIERAIEANASALAFTGIALGTTIDKRFLALSALVTGFLFQHAVQGWCPPVPILRRLGFRTAYEIEQERQALKALRGDFAGLVPKRRARSRRNGARDGAGHAARRRAKVAARAVRA
jgi:hypothetical protein